MAPSDGFASIADASKPNAGRIYDYVLGGSLNFEVDRQAAREAIKLRQPGFKPLEKCVGVSAGVGEAEQNTFGGFFIGAFFEK